MSEVTIPEIVEEWLKAHGYGGLTNDEDCGCALEDLAPCGGCMCSCFPAYNHGPRDGVDFWMSREKPGEKEP